MMRCKPCINTVFFYLGIRILKFDTNILCRKTMILLVDTHFKSNRIDMQINLIKEFDFFLFWRHQHPYLKNDLISWKKGRTQNWFLIRMQNDNILEREKNRHTKYLIINDSTCHVNVRKCNPGALWCMYE